MVVSRDAHKRSAVPESMDESMHELLRLFIARNVINNSNKQSRLYEKIDYYNSTQFNVISNPFLNSLYSIY